MVQRPSYILPADWEWIVAYCPSFAGTIAAIGWHETQWGALGAGRIGYLLGVGVPTSAKPKRVYRGFERQVSWACRKLRVFFATREFARVNLIEFGLQVWNPGYYMRGKYVKTGKQWASRVWHYREQIVSHKGFATTAKTRAVIHSEGVA